MLMRRGLNVKFAKNRSGSVSVIPPTQLVDYSYTAYRGGGHARLPEIPPTQLVDCSYPTYVSDLNVCLG